MAQEISLFNTFIEKFILGKKSLLDDELTFNTEDIDECLNKLKDKKVMNKPNNGEDKSLESALAEEDTSSKTYVLLWHCYYIMYLMGETAKKFFKLSVDKELFVEKGKGVASTNQAYNSEAIRPFRTMLNIFKQLWKKDIKDTEKVKEIIKDVLPKDNKDNEIDGRVKNILLYLCFPDKYVPIVSQNHKNSIWNNMCFLINKSKNEYDEDSFKDILNKIMDLNNNDSDNAKNGENNINSFYHKTIRPFWDTPTISMNADKKGNLPLITLLTFKKAIVLYGPPGTSKTYTAEELAKSVICTEFAKSMKVTDKTVVSQTKNQLFENFLKKEKGIFGKPIKSGKGSANQKVLSHIHRLQLHPNYSYDDFIVGKTIRNNDVDIQKGYLLNLIDEIEQDRKNNNSFANLPHIIILDEINRVDISRVFGELFKAMESDYRDDGVDLPASIITKKDGTKTDLLKLKVPVDLYFIGTMNMIDFSLEQIDFALRRRFAWVESNYDKDRLKSIIEYKTKKKGITDLSSENYLIESYISSCTALNDKISNQPNLGPAYKIGHTFFAEIIDIYGNEQFNVQDDKKWESAKDFLWHISIKPMIEAYCGTMDSKAQEDFIKQCKETFISSQNDNGNQ